MNGRRRLVALALGIVLGVLPGGAASAADPGPAGPPPRTQGRASPLERDRAHEDALILAEWVLLSDRLQVEVIQPLRNQGRALSDLASGAPTPADRVTAWRGYLVTFQGFADTASVSMAALGNSLITDPARLTAVDLATTMADLADRARRSSAALEETQGTPVDRLHRFNEIFTPAEILQSLLGRVARQHDAVMAAAQRVAGAKPGH